MSILVVCETNYSEAKAIYGEKTITHIVVGGRRAIEVRTLDKKEALIELDRAKQKLILAQQMYLKKYEKALNKFLDNNLQF